LTKPQQQLAANTQHTIYTTTYLSQTVAVRNRLERGIRQWAGSGCLNFWVLKNKLLLLLVLLLLQARVNSVCSGERRARERVCGFENDAQLKCDAPL
jgi:hypothetical protein